MLGLDSQKVMLTEYDPDWILFYELETKVIKTALSNLVVDIQHIGSTAIPGLKAKPIIDILVGLKSFDQIDSIINKMEDLGYTYACWSGIPDDYTFRKGDKTTHLVHIVRYDGDNWEHNIKFRDILKSNPGLVKQYEHLKEELARKYPDSRGEYTEGKSKFINEVVSDAIE